METHKKSLRVINALFFSLLSANVIYLIVARDTQSFEAYHHDSLVKLLFVWIPINAFYLWEVFKLRRIGLVRWVFIPFVLLAELFFIFIASNFARGVSGSEAQFFFFLYFLITPILHVLTGTMVRQKLSMMKIRKVTWVTYLFSASIGAIIMTYLHFRYFSGFLFQNILSALILSVLFFLLFSPLVLILVQLFSRHNKEEIVI
jgi:hypothetical protein